MDILEGLERIYVEGVKVDYSKTLVAIVYKNDTYEVVNKKRMDYLLGIKNAKRDQVFTYVYLEKKDLKELDKVA